MFQTEELINVDGIRVGSGGLTPGGLHIGQGLLDVSREVSRIVLNFLDLVLREPEPVPDVVLVVLLPLHLPVLLEFVHGEEDFEVVPHCILNDNS